MDLEDLLTFETKYSVMITKYFLDSLGMFIIILKYDLFESFFFFFSPAIAIKIAIFSVIANNCAFILIFTQHKKKRL